MIVEMVGGGVAFVPTDKGSADSFRVVCHLQTLIVGHVAISNKFQGRGALFQGR